MVSGTIGGSDRVTLPCRRFARITGFGQRHRHDFMRIDRIAARDDRLCQRERPAPVAHAIIRRSCQKAREGEAELVAVGMQAYRCVKVIAGLAVTLQMHECDGFTKPGFGQAWIGLNRLRVLAKRL